MTEDMHDLLPEQPALDTSDYVEQPDPFETDYHEIPGPDEGLSQSTGESLSTTDQSSSELNTEHPTNESKPQQPGSDQTGSDITIHTRPGGFEAPPNPESEPLETPRTPEKPTQYHGGGPEGRY